jgi:hypothetical protein
VLDANSAPIATLFVPRRGIQPSEIAVLINDNGSSWTGVGDFWGLMLEKAVHCLGIWHYGWAWNLASKMDGTSSEAKPAALGYVLVPRFSTGTNSARDFR